jgi:hypothetical protein
VVRTRIGPVPENTMYARMPSSPGFLRPQSVQVWGTPDLKRRRGDSVFVVDLLAELRKGQTAENLRPVEINDPQVLAFLQV